MSDAKDQHEPSMEEILASIRRIISEDGDGGEPGAEAEAKPATPAAAPSAPAAAAAPSSDAPAEAAPAATPKRLLIADVEEEEPVKEEEDDSDILMLTEEAEDELAAPPLDDSPLSLEPDEPPPEPEREPEPESEPIFARAVEPMPQPESEPAAEPVDDNDRLLSERAAAASLAAMSELVTRSHREPNIESLHMGQANQTLEDLTRELLRPILKSWLDDNLPQIVERIVREEIGRLALDAQRR